MVSEDTCRETPKYYKVEEVAEILRVTAWTVREYLKAGILKGSKPGGQWRISEDSLTEFLEAKHG